MGAGNRNTWALVTLLMLLFGTTTALGQANPELGDVESGDEAEGDPMGSGADFGGGAAASTEAQAGGTWAPPTGQVSTAPPPEFEDEEEMGSGRSDHARVVGHMGVGFFGIATVPVMGCAGLPCMQDANTGSLQVSAPTVGVRYWLDHGMGIEAALGFHNSSGETETTTGMTTMLLVEPSVTAFALHGGLPLVLADSGHFAFELIPYLNVGFSTGSYAGGMAGDTDISGFLLEVGGRVGAEVHFGFIDIPQLALQGSIGLGLTMTSRSAENSTAMLSIDQSGTQIATSVQGEPWDIFGGNISAIYYL